MSNGKVIVGKDAIQAQLAEIQAGIEAGTVKGLVVLNVDDASADAILAAAEGGVEAKVLTADEAAKLIQGSGLAGAVAVN